MTAPVGVDQAAAPLLPSHNCWFGRPYGPPIAFVVHTQSGGESGTVAEWLSSSSTLSAHYRVGLEGTLECWIDPADRAWSNGIVEPGNRWTAIARDCGIDPALNPNHVTVSCETEDLGDAAEPVTDLQYGALLCAAAEAKRRYPSSLRYLVRHADISPQSRPGCPGDRWLASGRFQALAETLGLKIVEQSPRPSTSGGSSRPVAMGALATRVHPAGPCWPALGYSH